MTSLYDTDFYAWAHEQAALLRDGAWQALDVGHLAEELALLAEGELGQLVNRLIILLTHLLKLQVAAQHLPMDLRRAGLGWRQTCQTQRVRLAQVLRRNPSLQPRLARAIDDAYDVALLEAAYGLGLAALPMPAACPLKGTQVLDQNFWPEVTT